MPYIEFKALFFLTFISLLVMNIVLMLKSKKNTGLEKEKEMLKNIKYRFSRK